MGEELVGRGEVIVDKVMGRLLAGLSDQDVQTLRIWLRGIAEAALPNA
jgi:hypothetical protein